MWIGRLGLEDFRSYARQEVAFAAGLNVVVGRNAQGKTNLLEAVHYLSGKGSPRGGDGALVRVGAERALLHGEVHQEQRTARVDVEIRRGNAMRALINRIPARGTRALGEVMATVFFGPEQLSLVKGSPEGRRAFLDELAGNLRPARGHLRRDWERVLKQRNALLKSAPHGAAARPTRLTFEVWDANLCRTGAALTAARLETLGRLLPYARKRYEAVAGAGRINLFYASDWAERATVEQGLLAPGPALEKALEGQLSVALEEVRTRELERGMSLVGPQRDDVEVATGTDEGPLLDARTHGSQGDQRTCALALKLAEHDLVSEALGQEPVLLLDDVFSELDPDRRVWLADVVRGMGQVLITSAEPGVVAAVTPSSVLTVGGGKVVRDG
ncbi:DNA replication/repair protein RecF [soil metagenome]